MSDEDFIVIVSGLPRSGTSAMMQMLAAGGMPLLTDGRRQPDADNPAGYFELEAVKALARDRRFLDGAAGKAVKIVHALLTHLPLDRDYRVIFTRRNLDEVLMSQRKMLDRHARAGAALTDAQLKAIYAGQVQQILRWLADYGNCIRTLEVDYGAMTSDPQLTAQAVNTFLGGKLDEHAMRTAVNPSLHRNVHRPTT
jgi:hypothetical protein